MIAQLITLNSPECRYEILIANITVAVLKHAHNLQYSRNASLKNPVEKSDYQITIYSCARSCDGNKTLLRIVYINRTQSRRDTYLTLVS